ncbi:MAG TPA: LysR family transcriptional regulator [Burkholderiaceae bacterium]|nr:LysR family transcriptional regulator [Burkholderiaceae bacterium]
MKIPQASSTLRGAPSLRQIEAFRLTMQLGSITRAAQALQVSQPSVSQLLSQLEAQTGLALFARQRGKLVPSAQAQVLLGEIERVVVGLEQLQLRIAALRGQGSVQLRVGCLHALASSLMPHAVREFQRQFAQSSTLLMVESSQQIKDALLAGALDLGFVADETSTQGLAASVFYEVPAVVAVPARHPFARRTRLGAKDLGGVPLIALSPSDHTQQRLDDAFAQAGVPMLQAVQTPYSATQCALVLAGAGLALTNPLVAAGFRADELRVVPFEPRVHFRSLIAFHPKLPQSAAVQEFVAICRTQLRQRYARWVV